MARIYILTIGYSMRWYSKDNVSDKKHEIISFYLY